MGLIDFVKNAGASLFGKDEPEPQAAPAEPTGPSAEAKTISTAATARIAPR